MWLRVCIGIFSISVHTVHVLYFLLWNFVAACSLVLIRARAASSYFSIMMFVLVSLDTKLLLENCDLFMKTLFEILFNFTNRVIEIDMLGSCCWVSCGYLCWRVPFLLCVEFDVIPSRWTSTAKSVVIVVHRFNCCIPTPSRSRPSHVRQTSLHCLWRKITPALNEVSLEWRMRRSCRKSRLCINSPSRRKSRSHSI